MGYMGPSVNRVPGKDFFYTYKQRSRHIFYKTYIRGKYVFVHFYELVFTLDTIRAEDKHMAGCKNQLIKVFEKVLAANIYHIKIMIYIWKIYHCQHFGLDFLLRNTNNNRCI